MAKGDQFPNATSRIIAAAGFAARKHEQQRRKGGRNIPYINHPIEVAELLSAHGVEDDGIVAALLHDTIEDTETAPEEIEEVFGERVLNLVLEMTDDKELPKQRRKEAQIERAPKKTLLAKQVHLADKICNVRDIGERPPEDWPAERQIAYLDWATKVVEGFGDCHAELQRLFAEAVDSSRRLVEARATVRGN